MSFADKAKKKANTRTCPICSDTIQFIRYIRAVKTDKGSWKMRPMNVGVCKCNSAEIYE